jgi:hypothetical protein
MSGRTRRADDRITAEPTTGDRPGPTGGVKAEAVVAEYAAAMKARDLDAARSLWAENGVWHKEPGPYCFSSASRVTGS